ncbi:MAG TPA: MBOAT family O-acyltransferase [Polyangiaceae bacterium]|nr:MBOAT family O-acyltransferase [Polyangiaceae bacterium]
MSFTTISFLTFCLIFFAGYALLRGRARGCFLLLASCYFYGSWDVRFLALLLGSVFVDFWVALAVAKAQGRRRRALLSISLAFNLGVLGFFKYAGFFAESAAAALSRLGWPVSAPELGIVLPVGISFYTFQTLAYTVNVYRGRLEPCRNLLDFALYVMFFPQLVAGPIERPERLLPQMAAVSRAPWRPNFSGLVLIASGLFKKLALADGVHAYVSPLSAPDSAYPAALWFATLAFAFQIYWDFSGYSDIAVGLARLLGVELMSNFRAPYAATGPSDFWQRWHISLSEWLRDYLYVPLGGNRGGPARTYRNLMLTMLLGGLWHGAAWHFVLWGAYHGLLLVAARALSAKLELTLPAWARPLRVIGFFYLTCLGWALFRAPTLAACVGAWKKLLFFDGLELGAWLEHLGAVHELRPIALWSCTFLAAWLLQVLRPESSKELADRLWRWPALPRALVVASLAYLAMLLAPLDPPDFIYFRF